MLLTKHALTTLVIWKANENQLHAGVNATMTAVWQMYWISYGRQSIKALLRTCVRCKLLVGKPYPAADPLPLAKSRVQLTEPFEVTGIDFTKAVFVRGDDERQKVYIFPNSVRLCCIKSSTP